MVVWVGRWGRRWKPGVLRMGEAESGGMELGMGGGNGMVVVVGVKSGVLVEGKMVLVMLGRWLEVELDLGTNEVDFVGEV